MLCPSVRYFEQHRAPRHPKKLTDWARQMLLPAPPRQSGQMGRPRKRGVRLPTLAQRLHDPSTCWHTLTIPGWYSTAKSYPNGQPGQREREVEVATGTAVWSNTGKAVVPIRWVLIRGVDP